MFFYQHFAFFQVINYIVTLDSIGIPFNYTNMSNDLMPKLFSDLEHTEPARIITR